MPHLRGFQLAIRWLSRHFKSIPGTLVLLVILKGVNVGLVHPLLSGRLDVRKGASVLRIGPERICLVVSVHGVSIHSISVHGISLVLVVLLILLLISLVLPLGLNGFLMLLHAQIGLVFELGPWWPSLHQEIARSDL